MPIFILEGIAKINGKRVSGIALREGISKKGNKYTIDQIRTARNQGIPLPLRDVHRGDVIGEISFSWDEKQKALMYDGVLTSPTKISQVRNGNYGVSIEAQADQVVTECEAQYCHPTPVGISLTGLAIESVPATFGTTIEIHEAIQQWPEQKNHKCDKCIEEGITEEKAELEKKVLDLELKVKNLTTCKKCGGIKKH